MTRWFDPDELSCGQCPRLPCWECIYGPVPEDQPSTFTSESVLYQDGPLPTDRESLERWLET